MHSDPTRRQVLKGVGICMGLPWMESLPVWGGEGKPTTTDAPKRFACLFFGNGVNTDQWWAKGQGAQMELGPVFQSLNELKEELILIKGLWQENATKGSIHSAQTGNILSGARLNPGGVVRAGISIDQMLAQRLGQDTRLPSLVLGAEAPMRGIHKGYSGVYSSNISWSSPTTPVPLELYPSLAFDSLFNMQRSKIDKSLLDRVMGHANHLKQKVSTHDQHKLDEYLTSVRELEKRIKVQDHKTGNEAWMPTLTSPNMERPQEGFIESLPERMKLMCDLIVLGMQTDTTRFATFMLNRDLSGMFFPHLGLTRADHHTMSHSSQKGEFAKVTKFLVNQYAYLVKKMHSIQEGERTLLENSCVMITSSIWRGSGHDNKEVPLLLAGKLGGTLKTGRSLNYRDKPNNERRMCSLYLSLLDRYGIDLKQFGDAKTRLAEI